MSYADVENDMKPYRGDFKHNFQFVRILITTHLLCMGLGSQTKVFFCPNLNSPIEDMEGNS